MKSIILNWKNGENDPFTVFNIALKKQFEAYGKNVDIIEITDENWISKLIDQIPNGIEFVFTWQGLGSNVRVNDQGDSLWNLLKIPLISLHGDHPSHMPINHQLESPYCFHLYNSAEHCRYSNQHFRRVYSARTISAYSMFDEKPLTEEIGNFFVFAKNITPTSETEAIWRNSLEKPIFDAFMAMAETFKSRLPQHDYVEVHDVVDELIKNNSWEWLLPSVNIGAFHQAHSQLDFYARNHRSIVALSSLRDFPVHIYGRGWDKCPELNSPSPHHRFHAGLDMAASQKLYYSRFGLLDISPAKGLHDRTIRAMLNKRGFLSSGNLEDIFTNIADYRSLFFDFQGNTLADKCAAVIQNPDQHRQTAAAFAELYYEKFHFQEFITKIECLAHTASLRK